MIKVFFDHQKFSTQRYGGISRYFANVINEIRRNKDFDYELGVLYSNNHYLKEDQGFLKRSAGDLFADLIDQRAYEINDWYSKRLLKKGNFDIFHPTYYDPYFIGRTNKPVVTTIHDMTYESLPEYFWAGDPLTYRKRLNAERADKIIAISETTKKDILAYLDVDPAKIEVIYHGVDLHTELEYKPVKDLPQDYLLFVGDRSGYKNFYLFLQAFKLLAHQYKDLKVVLTGGGALAVGDQEFIRRLKLEDRVTHVQVSDKELNFLYSNALVFVYPSLYEGFGLPILEAFKAKCPVILSDTECFREIGKDAAAFFDAGNEEELAALIEKIAHDSVTRQDLITKGLLRLQDFPITRSLEQTLDVYKSLL